jgi:hypothetical protein
MSARTVAAFALALALSACSATPRNAESWMARERNACLPTAIAMAQGLDRQGIPARVVRYSYTRDGRPVGHAITAYLYPPGANQLWTYDYEGSWRTRAYWADAHGIAGAAERLRGRHYKLTDAQFLNQ